MLGPKELVVILHAKSYPKRQDHGHVILMEDVKVHGSNSTACASMPSEAILALFLLGVLC